MKKKGLIAVIAAVVIILSACAVFLLLKSADGKDYATANESLKTAWNDYTKDSQNEVLKAVCEESKFSVKDIEKTDKNAVITVEVESKRFGEAIKDFKDKNKEILKEDEIKAKQLKLLEDAEDVEKTYELTALKSDNGYTFKLSPEFINAMLCYVFTDEQLKAENFEKTALDEFEKAIYINAEIEYDYEKIDSIMKSATTVSRYENKIYYADYHLESEGEEYTYYKRKLKCYDMLTGSDNTIKTFDCEWNENSVKAVYIGCLSDGALIVEENDEFDSENYQLNSYIYDYKEEKISKIKAENTIPAYEAAVLADYKDGTVYYTAGQDGFGDIKKFAPSDDAETTAIDFDGDFLMLNSIYARNSVIYSDLLDYDTLEKSGYKDEIYNVFINNGTSLGEKVISDIDGAFYADENSNFLYMRDGALISYSTETKAETEVVKTDLKYKNADIRFIIGDWVYVVVSVTDNEGYNPEMHKVNIKTGESQKLKGVTENALYRN